MGNRRSRRGAGTLALGLTIMILVGPVGAADPPSGTAQAITEERLRAEIDFRKQLGMRSDEAYVRSVQTATADRQWGFAATPAEAADMVRRIGIQNNLSRLKSYLESVPSFGGMYLDQKAAAVIDIAFAGESAGARAAAVGFIPSGAEVRFRTVPNTMAMLQTERSRIREAMLDRAPSASAIVSARTDVRSNVVEIGLDPSRGDIEAARAAYEKPGLVRVVFRKPPVPVACTAVDNCGQKPWRAGLAVESVGYPEDFECSTGFVIKAFNNLPGRWILTAGHCGKKPDPWEHVDALTTNLGNVTAEIYQTNLRAEASAIDINDGWGGNLAMVTPTIMRSITAAQGNNADGWGQVTCHNGAASALQVGQYLCGTLIDLDHDYFNDDGLFMLDHRVVDVDVRPGDSGAAVFGGNTAYGIVSAGDFPSGNHFDLMFYSHIYHVIDLVGGPQNTVLVQTHP